MADNWKHEGYGGNPIDSVIDLVTGGLLGTKERVSNTETGEERTVYVDHGQDVGEAIAKGQFVDKK